MGVERAADGAPRKRALADGAGPHPQSRRRLSRRRSDAYHRRRQQNRLKQPRSPGWRSTAYYRRVFIRLSCTSYLHLPATSTILTPCQHHTSTTFTSCGTLPRTPTSMLAIPLTAARLKTHNAGHVPHTSKFAPWEIHSAIAVQTEEQASELEKYFKSHSGREWVIKHLGLPMGMTSHS